jgi:hypothetical protein
MLAARKTMCRSLEQVTRLLYTDSLALREPIRMFREPAIQNAFVIYLPDVKAIFQVGV